MSDIGKPERVTQDRVIALFQNKLGYRYLGDWTDRIGNSNIEEGLLTAHLTKGDYTPAQISRTLDALHREADNHSRNLYGNNKAVYKLLRYGVSVKVETGQPTETVHLINWKQPLQNDFAIAEEVTLKAILSAAPIWCCTSTASSSARSSLKTAASASVMASAAPTAWTARTRTLATPWPTRTCSRTW